MAEPIGTYRYRAFGLEISSPLPIPEFFPSDGVSAVDIQIQFEDVVPHPNGNPKNQRLIYVDESGPRFFWKNIANFHVSTTGVVSIDPLLNASEPGIRSALVGVVMGAVLDSQGIFALHASCVEVDGKALAFVGEKGHGKSTITASLLAQGFNLISDDILAIDKAALTKGIVLAVPGFPQVKLSSETRSILKPSDGLLHSLKPLSDKLAYRDPSRYQEAPLPLHSVNVLMFGPTIGWQSLSKKNGLLFVLRHSYATRVLTTAGNTKQNFLSAQRIAAGTDFNVISRPRQLDKISDVAKFIVESVRSPGDLQ
jgi:hypothetical protein